MSLMLLNMSMQTHWSASCCVIIFLHQHRVDIFLLSSSALRLFPETYIRCLVDAHRHYNITVRFAHIHTLYGVCTQLWKSFFMSTVLLFTFLNIMQSAQFCSTSVLHALLVRSSKWQRCCWFLSISITTYAMFQMQRWSARGIIIQE